MLPGEAGPVAAEAPGYSDRVLWPFTKKLPSSSSVSGPPREAAAAGMTASTGGIAQSRETRRWNGCAFMGCLPCCWLNVTPSGWSSICPQPGATPAVKTSHMEKDEREIRALIETWMAATKAGDVETVLGLMTDDVVFLVPGRPPMGRSEFAAAAKTQAQGAAPRIDGASEIREIKVLGDWAYLWTR